MTPVEQKTKALDERAAIKEPLFDQIADVRDSGLEWPVWVQAV